MFDVLVESGSHKEDLQRKGSFLLGTAIIYGLLILGFFVLSIYLYEARLDAQNLELVALVAPVPVQQQPEQQQQQEQPKQTTTQQQVATRTELIASTLDPTKVPEKPSTAASKVPPVPPNMPVALGKTNTDPVGPSGPVGPPGVVGVVGGTGTGSRVVNVEEPPPPPAPTPTPKKIIQSGGVLNGKAISLPQPVYPPMAKAARVSGTVNVQVLVDETGKVISATAVSGHPLLRQAAVQAAYRARFTPTLLSGQPVKVQGIITYNFVL
jgi:protein TonB